MEISGPEPLAAAHILDGFSCGKPSLDRWLKTRALSNQEKGFTAVIVVHEASRVVGYYGLAPTAIVPSRLPRSIRTGQPPDPVPCLLLGQLATDQSWIDKGIHSANDREELPVQFGEVPWPFLSSNSETSDPATV